MAKRKKEDSGPSGGSWIDTFADLMNLLLCFFVLLFSMSSVDVDKFEALVQSLEHSFSILPAGGASVGDGQMVSAGISHLLLLDEYYKPEANSSSLENAGSGKEAEIEGEEEGKGEKDSEEELKEETDALTELFRKALNNEKLEVKVEKLKNEKVSSMITLSEENRRMQEMMKMYNMYGMDSGAFGASTTLILNANNALVKYLFQHPESEHANMICEQLYDLAMISHQPLAPEAMTRFVTRSNELMMLLTK